MPRFLWYINCGNATRKPNFLKSVMFQAINISNHDRVHLAHNAHLISTDKLTKMYL